MADDPKPAAASSNPRTLAVDVGGTGIKAMILDPKGSAISERLKVATPDNATPKKVLGIISDLAEKSGEFDRVSVGFPGVVKDGVVYTAPNLGKGWEGYPLEEELADKVDRPVRAANDADVQGLACVTGKGEELVITLGTGFGSVLFSEGHRIHLELGHHPFHKGKTYEDELGHRALKKKGKKRWNKMLREAIDDLARTFNYDRLYIGGGSSEMISFKLPPNVTKVSNQDGILGGIKLWSEDNRVKTPKAPRIKAKPKPKAKAQPVRQQPEKPRAARQPVPKPQPEATASSQSASAPQEPPIQQ